MSRQFVKCRFNPWDQRTYTYHHDGEPVAEGDKVQVETAKGIVVIEVVGLTDEQPKFETKPIIGKHISEEIDNGQ